ncbi:MAG: hypothetical protein DCC67_15055 [Planctomycetota bacterium]|nr:MAG: hypothetical protein DCC67_15055 [Planctomycetota bacterium]
MAAFGLDPQALFGKLVPFTRTTKPQAAGCQKRRSLQFESLESRQMMAADMAEIVGVVRLDAQNDGNAANDAVVAGANVQLYRDNGNGAFDAGDAMVGAAATTDALGKYRFSGIAAGKYFVKLVPPASMQTKPDGQVREVVVTAEDADGAIGPAIDDFNSTQVADAAPPLPASESSTLDDSNVMGGERDLFVELTDGTDVWSSVSLISGGGFLRLASGSMVQGNAKVVWDGQDGSATAINPTGLGGLDFTRHGGNSMTGVMLSVGADHPESVVKLKVYTDAGRWTEFTAIVPQTPGGAPTKVLVFNFADAPTASAGGGADFSNVGAVELNFVGVTAVDGQVSLVGLIGLTTKTADFTAYNRLSLGDRVWNDANNNGQLDGGEQGISGVTLNLYNDADGNNQYTPGVDALVASTATDAAGHYTFADLLPGAYVVQVDAANFQAGQPLAGLQSSTPAAADPDNLADGDDNGVPLAGHGVVSQAISLLASSSTVDFGFYGFDLVLDKSVQQHTVSPLETITYAVRVVNDGPGVAKNVQFIDNLPAGVTFKSLSVSKTGVTLVHSAGTISGGLGDMAAGAEVVVTILAEVNATATGVLRNEAEVSALHEENTLNNRDEVENPIEPKIDLEIVKTDSKDPVSPGEQFSYAVTVKNNGPSTATGVFVKDILPAAGVTYVGSSLTPDGGLVDRELLYNLGSMAAGETRSFTITVQVAQDFSGTLLNHVMVEANETETRLDNNEDDEPTVVKVDPAQISGYVYVDKNDNGYRDAGEKPISNVVITLSGVDMFGATVTRTTATDANGFYNFDNLTPGAYNLNQPNQPAKYKDGKDSLGDTFNGLGQPMPVNGQVAPDTVGDDQRDGDALEGVVLGSGFEALDYNFGELAVTTSKVDFIRAIRYR